MLLHTKCNIWNLFFSCRYVFGGDHGRLKFGPPDEHSPVIESLPPKEKMRIEPCYYFGELNKNIISGPTEICDYHPFVPNPVSTSHVRALPCHLYCTVHVLICLVTGKIVLVDGVRIIFSGYGSVVYCVISGPDGRTLRLLA